MTLTVTRLTLIVLSFVLAYYLSWLFGALYLSIFSDIIGGTGFFPADAARSLIGAAAALITLVIFSITTVGGRNMYWWIGIALIPAILFEALIDPLHIYFPIFLGLITWSLARIAHKALNKFAPGLMARLG